MAEINTPVSKKKKSLAPVLKKKLLRVDLTPMVDLGFLLITFFMFATTLSEPRAMKLLMPKECPDCPIEVAKEKGLILILGKNNLVYSYEAMDPENSFRINSFESIRDFRNSIADKKRRTMDAMPGDARLVISIKTTDEATYGNFVDIMDEVQITNAGIPIVDKVTDDEKKMIEKTMAAL
jgi:biopolymer transport protein ExbD